jgi:hypothetical protein
MHYLQREGCLDADNDIRSDEFLLERLESRLTTVIRHRIT